MDDLPGYEDYLDRSRPSQELPSYDDFEQQNTLEQLRNVSNKEIYCRFGDFLINQITKNLNIICNNQNCGNIYRRQIYLNDEYRGLLEVAGRTRPARPHSITYYRQEHTFDSIDIFLDIRNLSLEDFRQTVQFLCFQIQSLEDE